MRAKRIEVETSEYYDFVKSMNFVYIKDVRVPEYWDRENRKLYIVANGIPLIIYKQGDKLIIEVLSKGQFSYQRIENFVLYKLNLDNVEVVQEGWKALEVLGIAAKFELAKGFIPPKLSDPKSPLYTALIRTIFLQMVSVPAALHMTNRFITAFGKRFYVDNKIFYDFPESGAIIRVDDRKIKEQSGTSMLKAKAIKEVAKLHYEGKLDKLINLDDNALLDELQKIKGVGHWTAVVTMMAGLGRWAVQPLDRLSSHLKRVLGVDAPMPLLAQFRHCAGYLSVCTMFLDEALRKRYFKV